MRGVGSVPRRSLFVPRTTQTGFLAVTRDEVVETATASPVLRRRRPTALGQSCADEPRRRLAAQPTASSLHELGHVLGFHHEHQRSDRDNYVTIDIGNVAGNARFAFDKYTFPVVGAYDFGSIMHYGDRVFAIDTAKPVIIPRPGYQSFATMMGRASSPSRADYDGLAFLYGAQLRASTITAHSTQPRAFNRDEFILAMERLNALYMSRYGLQRPLDPRSTAPRTSWASRSGSSTSISVPAPQAAA